MNSLEDEIAQTTPMARPPARFALALELDDETRARTVGHAQRSLASLVSVIETSPDAAIIELAGGPPTEALRDVRSLARRFHRVIDSGKAWIGVAPVSGHNLDGAIREARRAIELAKLLSLSPRAVLYEDLLLADLLERDRSACVRMAMMLEAVLEYDRANRWVLLSTLAAYVEASLSARAAARRLSVHRHTVDYRIRRIETLLGRSLKSSQDLLLIQTSILANHLLGRIGAAP